MKRNILLFSLITLLCACQTSNGLSSISFEERTYSDLSSIYIKTDGSKIPSRDDPNYDEYLPCELSLDNLSYNPSRIRIRGTSSRYFDKKGYKIKFDKKTSLYNFTSQKKYNLLATYMDPLKLRDYLPLMISRHLAMDSNRYAPNIKGINVYLNDTYQGVYLFTDDIGKGKGKIEFCDYNDVDTSIPYILEMDTVAFRDGEENVDYFSLGYTTVFDYDHDGGTPLLYKVDTPSRKDGLTDNQFNFIKDDISNIRQLLVDQDINAFMEKVDINSFIDYFLLAELFMNTDAAGRSVYMYKTSPSSKLIYGPSWDFDYSCSRPWGLKPNTDYTLENATERFTDYDWWSLFLKIEGSTKLIEDRYQIVRQYFKYEVDEAFRYFDSVLKYVKEDASIWYDTTLYNIDELIINNYNWFKDYLSIRLNYFDSLYVKNN